MKYSPDAVPNDARPGLRAWLALQFRTIATALLELEPNTLQLTELHAEPERPRVGMIVLADGSDWDPGSGAGYYGYHSSQWNKLG